MLFTQPRVISASPLSRVSNSPLYPARRDPLHVSTDEYTHPASSPSLQSKVSQTTHPAPFSANVLLYHYGLHRSIALLAQVRRYMHV